MSSSLRSSAAEAVARILERIESTADAVRPSFPLAADGERGLWQTHRDGRWTGGFWVGLLWVAHHYTGKTEYAALAREWMERLAPRVAVDNVLNGLVFYYGAALGAVLARDEQAQALALAAARALGERFDPATRIVPLGRDSGSVTADARTETNIDGLPGMALLLWAADERGDAGLGDRALSHAHRHVEACQRPDGSLFQAATFDPGSGAVVRRFTPRGYADESTWARAQSWGLLGLVQAARWDGTLLGAARRAAEFWIRRTADDPVAFWDFDDPSIPAVERDTSATAMAAAALLKLAALVPNQVEAARYRAHAETTVDALVRGYLTPVHGGDQRPPGMLTEGCWQRRQRIAVKHELIWGDYFLLEALVAIERGLPTV